MICLNSYIISSNRIEDLYEKFNRINFEIIIFIFSVMSYALYALILKIFRFSDTKIHFLSDIFSKTNEFDYLEIFYVTLVAIFTVIIYSFFVNKKSYL